MAQHCHPPHVVHCGPHLSAHGGESTPIAPSGICMAPAISATMHGRACDRRGRARLGHVALAATCPNSRIKRSLCPWAQRRTCGYHMARHALCDRCAASALFARPRCCESHFGSEGRPECLFKAPHGALGRMACKFSSLVLAKLEIRERVCPRVGATLVRSESKQASHFNRQRGLGQLPVDYFWTWWASVRRCRHSSQMCQCRCCVRPAIAQLVEHLIESRCRLAT